MRYRIISLIAGSMLMSTVNAANVFQVTAAVTEQAGSEYSFTVGTSNAEELFQVLDSRQRPAGTDSRFDGSEIVVADVLYRGLDMELSFNEFANTLNNTLCVGISGVPAPSNRSNATCGTDAFEFSATSRQAALDAFADYLKSNEDGTASRLNQQLVRSSPNDPIAGNPGSLQSRVAAADFNQSFTQRVSQVWGCSTSASATQMLMLAKAGFGCGLDVADANFRLPTIEVAQLGGPASYAANVGLYDDYFSSIDRQRGENKLNIGVDYALISATPGGGTELETSVLTLPLSYSFVFNGDPRKKFVVRLPLSLSKTEEATAYQIGLSLAYSHPISDVWSISPGLGYSAVGSEDLASAAALTSFSLSSSYTLDFGGWALNIGNTIGQYSTGKVKIGDYESDPDISNTIFTNGLLLSGPSSLLANDLVVEYFITDTRYSGDALFTDNSQEVGINFGKLNTSNEVVTSYLKAGISYAMASGDNSNEADVLRLSLQFKF
ncbi:MAG: hypothetical protein ACSHXK_13000 [Oceanococcus sp.]